ncbi:hypothetical protein A8B78_08665 [Jannaschia sp. EhC01]|nr:hypothetical protein A8B78_08665 [Jannaschia sp. EhC01]
MRLTEMMTQSNAAIGSLSAGIAGVLLNRAKGASGSGATDSARVHLFAGMFPDEAAMFAYCFTPTSPNGPEQLNLDLPGAPIDTSLVEAVFGDQIDRRLTEYFGPKERKRIKTRLRGARALVMVPTQASGGLEFRLHDTPKLRHMGYEQSLAPAIWSMTP